jgi:hypothetical protein
MSVPHSLSVTLHRFVIRTNCTLDEFALNTVNCVLTNESGWRCTHYGTDFTSNVFVASKLPYYALVAMSFSKQKSFETYKEYFKVLFGEDTVLQDFTLINWVEKFYTPCNNISLTKLESMFIDGNDGAFIKRVTRKKKNDVKVRVKPGKIKSYANNGYISDDSDFTPELPRISIGTDDGTAPTVNMDQQKFSALSIYPYPKESNFVIEVFATGNLNVAGIPDANYFEERVIPYINNKLMTCLRECSMTFDAVQLDSLRDEFVF